MQKKLFSLAILLLVTTKFSSAIPAFATSLETTYAAVSATNYEKRNS